ncbi:hypothetical protein CL634_04925 [bacterium]|nr:hypothetical protein [bacterium]
MDPQEEHKAQRKEVVTFDDMDVFFNALSAERIWGTDPQLHTFWVAYDHINQGCGCRKKARIAAAEVKYLEMAGLHEATQVFLKASFNTKKIRLAHNDEIFCEY